MGSGVSDDPSNRSISVSYRGHAAADDPVRDADLGGRRPMAEHPLLGGRCRRVGGRLVRGELWAVTSASTGCERFYERRRG